jgi:hypothetical protein
MKFCILVLFCCHIWVGRCTLFEEPPVRQVSYSILPKVLQHVKKSRYNQPKPYFFKKLL